MISYFTKYHIFYDLYSEDGREQTLDYGITFAIKMHKFSLFYGNSKVLL